MEDMIKETANFVRGTMEDALTREYSKECSYCFNPVEPRSTCVSNCPNCGNEMHTCGD